MRTSTYAASDFKTVYASAWCFAHRLDAYDIANLQQVFIANGVTQPERWYGHAPVYPWPTLALLAPLCRMSMVHAAYTFILLSGALLALAIAALMRYAADQFGMGPAWRITIAALCAGGPLLAFGMAMGNVSLAASALCFLALARRGGGGLQASRGRTWAPAAALAIALLLKPHLAFWVALGMVLLPERAGRAVAVRATALCVGFTALIAGWMATMGTLGLQTQAYLAMLAAETSGSASMSAASREMLPVVAQITSLRSILGYWIANRALLAGVTCAALLGFGLLLLRLTRRVQTERAALLAVGAWCALGMLATYHRAHDAVLLLLLTPWVVERVRRSPRDWSAWAAAALHGAMSASLEFGVVERWVSAASAHSLIAFVLLRQAGLADLLLLAVLLPALAHEAVRSDIREERAREERDLRVAA